VLAPRAGKKGRIEEGGFKKTLGGMLGEERFLPGGGGGKHKKRFPMLRGASNLSKRSPKKLWRGKPARRVQEGSGVEGEGFTAISTRKARRRKKARTSSRRPHLAKAHPLREKKSHPLDRGERRSTIILDDKGGAGEKKERAQLRR